MSKFVFPSINTGETSNLDVDRFSCQIIIQEKADGGQFSIENIEGKLVFSNKGKIISGKAYPFVNSYISLVNKVEFFKEGYLYHGEAMRSRKPNTNEYDREPRYFWVLFEIVDIKTGYIFTPEETKEMIKDTGIEYLSPLYDSYVDPLPQKSYHEIIDNFMNKIESGQIESVLGGMMEGIVFKALNQDNKGKIKNTRLKFVRSKFSELNQQKKAKLPTLSDEELIENIGLVYNVPARFQKAKQHLEENGKWKSNPKANFQTMVHELDEDLIKEHSEDIKNILFCRFHDKIVRNARKDLTAFMESLE
jgi:hypothetical protein